MQPFRVNLASSRSSILMVTAALVGGWIVQPAFAATSSKFKQIEARIGGVNKTVFLEHPTQLNWEYANDENCGAAHKTAKGNRFFAHKHVAAYAFPCNGVDDAGNPVNNVTTAMIRDFWEWNNGGQYYSYDHSGAEDVTYNCFGYAMGPAVWIQDPSYIYADDYEASGVQAGTIWPIGGNAHVIKIVSICDNGEPFNFVSHTSEKNRCSRIEDFTAYCPGGIGTSGLLKKKP